MSAKKVLITGGSGFVGRNVIETLREKRPDIEIYNFSKHPLSIPDVTDIAGDAQAFDPRTINIQFDYIIHLLALSNEKYCADLTYAQDINIGFTKKLLDYAREQKLLKKFIHLSSIIIYDNKNIPPVREDAALYLNYTNYSFTKGIAEHCVNFYREKFGVPIIIFRLSNIYGPHQAFTDSPFLVPSKIIQGLSEHRIEVFNAKPRRDWIYSGDAAEAIVASLDVDYRGVLNLASGRAVSVGEIMEEISSQLGITYTSLDKPTTGPLDFYCDISNITRVLPWKPTTDLREGIAETINDIKETMQRS